MDHFIQSSTSTRGHKYQWHLIQYGHGTAKVDFGPQIRVINESMLAMPP
jgi:hypothetical protein